MQQLTKKTLIKTTYDIIWEHGMEDITIRGIATRLSCSSAALYRHFDNLDHLLTYACVPFLEPYIEEYKLISLTSDNALDISLKMWDLFAKTSFYNPQIYVQMFLGPYWKQLPEIIRDYYCIFDADIFNVGETLYYMEILADIFFQNRKYLQQCTSYSEKEMDRLSDLTVYTYAGMLATLTKKEYPVWEVEEMLQKFHDCLMFIYRI